MVKYMQFLQKTPHFDFIKVAKRLMPIVVFFILGSIGLVCFKGMNYGIDFKGGILIEVKMDKPVQTVILRQKLNDLKLEDLTIQSLGLEQTDFQIYTTGKKASAQNEVSVLNEIKGALGTGVSYQQVEMVGPKIGNELIKKSIWAAILATICIGLYIAFRFEWPFAVTAMLGLVHDLILTTGFISLFGLDFNLTLVAALMSLAGYSVNDTVVTFDRVRDTLKKNRKMEIKDILNKGINETLSRTLMTSLTTIIMLVILLFFGGENLFGFSAVFLFGIFVGTFSSVFIAVPLLNLFDLHKISEDKSLGNERFAGAERYEREAQQMPLK